MYERFTDRARKVMQLAYERARRLNQQYIGPDHILLGLLMEGGGIGVEALRNLGVNLHELESTLESLLERGAGPVPAKRRLPPLPGAQKEMEDLSSELRIPSADLEAELKRLNSAK